MIDVNKIVSDTLTVFENSTDKLSSLPSVSTEDYLKLHTSPLTALNLKIDCEYFEREIAAYNSYFYQWGTQFADLPRYGLALVNQDGVLKANDPINGSLYEWNSKFPDKPLLETDCRTPTNVMSMQSLNPLRVFDGHWCRSNIFKWEAGAKFMPHIDTVVPSPWIRLWGTTDASTTQVNFYNEKGPIDVGPIESGRIYVIDTSLVHDASATGLVYQFFLSVLPSSYQQLNQMRL